MASKQQLKLADGRSLDYLVHPASGKLPLVFIHGSPGSLFPPPGLARACKEKDIPLITFSRPGYGDSTRQKGRKIVDVVKDIEALLDHLGHKECMIAGWSGGGPHALASAARLDGCRSALVIATPAPYDADGLDWIAGTGQDNIDETEATLKGEPALQEYYVPQREMMLKSSTEEMLKEHASLFPPVDDKVMRNDKEMGEFFDKGTAEALKHNSDGAVDDGMAFLDPWGFHVADVRVPVVLLHGTEDKMCPYSHGEWVASKIPKKYLNAHLEKDQGHISIFIGREAQWLDELVQLAGAA